MKALITGASSGIGAEYARQLADMGYELIITARREERLEALKNELKNTKITVFPCDLRVEDECFSLFEKFPDADVVINNAGFGVFGNFVNTDIHKELDMINVNIRAVHILTKLYAKEMTKRKRGYILNVASSAAFFPGPMFSGYYASKSYIYRLSTAIAEEMKTTDTNVQISVFCPGPVDTEFNDVAGVRFSMKPLTAEYAARYSLKKLFKNKTVIIPDISNKLCKLASKIVPEKISSKVVYKIQKSKAQNRT